LSADWDPRLATTSPASVAAEEWDDLRLQKLWIGAERNGWRLLAVMGASEHVNTLVVAELFAQLAWRYRGEPSLVRDLRDLSMRLVDYQVNEMKDLIAAGNRLVIALRSISENPTSALMARQADGVALCIALGETDFRRAEQTIAAVGRERVVGAVVFRRSAKKKK
jgi:hypothetical protein